MFREISRCQGNVVRLAHIIFQEILIPGDCVVDATCGNGQDCLFLARLLQGKGKVVAYDVQQEALDRAKCLCAASLSEEEYKTIEFKKQSHEYINEVGARLFHYNLGYLPRGDKCITTLKETTIASIQKALTLVANQGVITVVCYPGHREGEKEMTALETLGKELDVQKWEVGTFYVINRNKAPRLLVFRSL